MFTCIFLQRGQALKSTKYNESDEVLFPKSTVCVCRTFQEVLMLFFKFVTLVVTQYPFAKSSTHRSEMRAAKDKNWLATREFFMKVQHVSKNLNVVVFKRKVNYECISQFTLSNKNAQINFSISDVNILVLFNISEHAGRSWQVDEISEMALR